MDLLCGYGSDESSGDNQQNKSTTALKATAAAAVAPKTTVQRPDRSFLQAAPAISVMAKRKHGNELIVRRDPSTNLVVTEPIQGPAMDDPQSQKFKTGEMEDNVKIDHADFNKQRTKFQNTGLAQDPNNPSSMVVRTTLGYSKHRLRELEWKEHERKNSKRAKLMAQQSTKGAGGKRENEPLVYGSDDEAVYGVWAPPSLEEQAHAESTLTDIQVHGVDGLKPEQLAEREHLKERDRLMGKKTEEIEEQSGFERLMERKMAHLLPPKLASGEHEPAEAKTTFHGESETDYKGKSWIAPPTGLGSIAAGDALDMDHHKCYIPKKCVHRFTGHHKGVQRIRLFPKTGHLLLSAGLEGKCKVWSVPDKKVMRTYDGHRAAVRDVQFNSDGTKFVSASFDRFLRLWDTESGDVLQTFCNKKVPYCVEFYPHDDNFFVVGYSDNKIVTYDASTGDIAQEYNHHLAPVNAIVFVEDNGTKMVTSSDDKKVLVWEWDIGVPIKYISDPTMHSMPCLAMHPSQSFFVAQSLDNHICVFQAGNRFTLQKKKKFSGHQVAGYACQPGFSPDGQYLISGDGKGKLWFWDWKRTKILQKFKAHDNGPAIDCLWHPLNPSTVFTCGWDGIIKMWE